MKRNRDITVSSPTLDAAQLARYVELFAQRTKGWECPLEKSQAYEKACEGPSCCVVAIAYGLELAAVHLTQAGSNSLRATNIVPLELDELSIDQYNAVAVGFMKSLQKAAVNDEQDVRVSISKGTVALKDLITGKYPTQFFRQYVAQYPRSGHQSDLDRLDKFICSLARWSRKPFHLHVFEYLLIEELGWPEAEAKRCRLRVEIGLEVIAMYKRF